MTGRALHAFRKLEVILAANHIRQCCTPQSDTLRALFDIAFRYGSPRYARPEFDALRPPGYFEAASGGAYWSCLAGELAARAITLQLFGGHHAAKGSPRTVQP